MNTTPVNILTLHEDIKNTLRSKFTTNAIPTIEYYSRVQTKVIVPAIFFELVSVTGNTDSATGQFDGTFKFSAYCVLPFTTDMAIVKTRALACELAGKITGERFGHSIMPAKVTLIEPDNFEAENPQYETVRVDWEQDGLLGTDMFSTGEDFIPTEVWFGFTPYTGVENIDKYIKVYPK